MAVLAERTDLVPALLGRPEAPVVLVSPPSGAEPFDAAAARGVGMVVVEVPVLRGAPLPLEVIAELQAEGHQVGVVLVDDPGPGQGGVAADYPAASAKTDPETRAGWEAGAILRLVAAGVRTIRGADRQGARQTLAVHATLAAAKAEP